MTLIRWFHLACLISALALHTVHSLSFSIPFFKMTTQHEATAPTDQTYHMKPHPKGYVCMRAATPPAIDGKVSGPGWDDAPWTDEFADIEDPSKPAPYFSTRVKMLWDDTALYVGAWLEEPQPWANLTLHDDVIYKDNDFEVFIDPDGDNHQYYEFEVNALNAWWDLFLVKPYRDGGPALHSFESISPSEPTVRDGPTGWEPVRRAVWVDGAVNDPSVTSKGWGVTIAFPWSLLRQAAHVDCPPKPQQQWRINFSRVQWHVRWDPAAQRYVKDPADQAEQNWVWSPQWEIAMHKPEYWGYLQFSDQVASSTTAAAAAHMGHPDAPMNPSSTSDHAMFSSFQADPDWPLRCFLMEIYYRQKAFFDANKVFAGTLAQLGHLPVPDDLQHADVRMQSTEVSFVASGSVNNTIHTPAQSPASGPQQQRRLYINEEGRFVFRDRCMQAQQSAM